MVIVGYFLESFTTIYSTLIFICYLARITERAHYAYKICTLVNAKFSLSADLLVFYKSISNSSSP